MQIDTAPFDTDLLDLPIPQDSQFSILALPATQTTAYQLVCSAVDEAELLDESVNYLAHNAPHGDINGFGVQPVAGGIGETYARIDLVNERLAPYLRKRFDLIVASSSLLPMPVRSLTIRRELGKTVAAFTKNGIPIHYLVSDSVRMVEFALKLREEIKSLEKRGAIHSVEKIVLWSNDRRKHFRLLKRPIEIEDQPAPTNMTYQVGIGRRRENAVLKNRQQLASSTHRSAVVGGTLLAMLLVALAFIGLINWQIDVESAELAELQQEAAEVERLKAKWQRVERAVYADAQWTKDWQFLKSLEQLHDTIVDEIQFVEGHLSFRCRSRSKIDLSKFYRGITENPRYSDINWQYDIEQTNDRYVYFRITGNHDEAG